MVILLVGLTFLETISQFTSEGMRCAETEKKILRGQKKERKKKKILENPESIQYFPGGD